jgi:hypothetical protein
MATKSAHLRPGEKPCEGCNGSGRNKADTDACPACRGWGSRPPDPRAPEAPAGSICPACGRPARDGDPVLADKGGLIHLSHAMEMSSMYADAMAILNRTGQL